MMRVLLLVPLLLAVGCGSRNDKPGKTHDPHGDHGGHEMPAKGYALALDPTPATIEAGKPVKLTMTIRDPKGSPVREFERVHEERLHLILIREGLDQFAHLHPTIDDTGTITQSHTFPIGGSYHVYADFKPVGQNQTVAAANLMVTGESPSALPLKVNVPGNVKGEGLNAAVSIEGAKALGKTSIRFELRDDEGKAVTDLQQYLGEKGHLVVVSADAKDFVHSHPGHAEDAPGNVVVFEAHFPRSGLYKGWGQFKRQNRVHVVPFVLNVE